MRLAGVDFACCRLGPMHLGIPDIRFPHPREFACVGGGADLKDAQSYAREAQRLAVFLFLKEKLESLSAARSWQILIASMVGIVLLDYWVDPTGVHLGSLYLLPICLAGWRLGFRAAFGVAVTASVLSVADCYITKGYLSSGAAGNMLLHIFSLTVIAGIVSSFRHSFERERFLACRDGMTGALNKPAFEKKAEAMLAAATANGRSLLLAYLDLDGFKIVNDRFGHVAGDAVLEHFGAEARSALRSQDCFGRMGGDEFAVLILLPERQPAQQIAEQLHDRLTAALAETAHAVTCSMGALLVPADGRASMDELLRDADRLMYAVKNGSKNGMRFSVPAPSLDVELPLFSRLGSTVATEVRSGVESSCSSSLIARQGI